MEYESYSIFLNLEKLTITTIFEFKHNYQCIVRVVMDVIS